MTKMQIMTPIRCSFIVAICSRVLITLNLDATAYSDILVFQLLTALKSSSYTSYIPIPVINVLVPFKVVWSLSTKLLQHR